MDSVSHGGTTPLAPPASVSHGGTSPKAPLAPPARANPGGPTPLAPPASANPDRQAYVDLGAITGNVAALCERVRGSQVMAVVKADGYGHGMVDRKSVV